MTLTEKKTFKFSDDINIEGQITIKDSPDNKSETVGIVRILEQSFKHGHSFALNINGVNSVNIKLKEIVTTKRRD